MTAWIPLGDLEPEQGTLMVLPRSHADEAYDAVRTRYGALDVDRDAPNDPRASGHLTDCPDSWRKKDGMRVAWDHDAVLSATPAAARRAWASEAFCMGDVVVFGMETLHMSTTNLGGDFRISCDTRWQPAADPVDERWAGGPADGAPHRFFCGDDPNPEGNRQVRAAQEPRGADGNPSR